MRITITHCHFFQQCSLCCVGYTRYISAFETVIIIFYISNHPIMYCLYFLIIRHIFFNNRFNNLVYPFSNCFSVYRYFVLIFFTAGRCLNYGGSFLFCTNFTAFCNRYHTLFLTLIRYCINAVKQRNRVSISRKKVNMGRCKFNFVCCRNGNSFFLGIRIRLT